MLRVQGRQRSAGTLNERGTVSSLGKSLGLVLVIAALLAACGGNDTAPTVAVPASETSDSAVTASPSEDRQLALDKAERLLSSWNRELTPIFLLLKRRSTFQQSGARVAAGLVGGRIVKRLEPVQRYGRDARMAFLDLAGSPTAEAVTDSGDAWSVFALRARHFLQGEQVTFSEGQKLADLAAAAIAAERKAFKVAGLPIPAGLKLG